MAKINKSIAQFGMPAGMNRAEAGPLDLSSVYYDKASMEAYAQSGKVAYVGQILSLVDEEKGIVEVYSIQDLNGTLKKVGTAPVGDEETITVAEDGTVSLYGVEGLSWKTGEGEEETDVTTYQPLLTKDSEGNPQLTWIIPSATTVEGLASEIEGLKTTTGTLTTAVATLQSKVDTGDKTVSAYIAEEIAKAEMAAMEFKGAITELPTGLTVENTGHFYKAAADISVDAATISGPLADGTYLLQGQAPISGKFYTEILSVTEGSPFSKATITLIFDPLVVDPNNISGYSSHEESFTITPSTLSVNYNWSEVNVGGADPCPNKIKIEYTSYSDELLEFVCLTNVEPIDLSVIKKGDSVVWSGHVWYVIPSGDDIEDTWRKIYINNIALSNTVDLKFVDSEQVQVKYDVDKNEVSFDVNVDLSEYKVKDVGTPSGTGNVVTDISLGEDGVIAITKGNIEVPDITIASESAVTAGDGEIAVIKELKVDETDKHKIISVPGVAATKTYVDTEIAGTAITVIAADGNSEAAGEKGVLVVADVIKTEGTNHGITVSTVEVATKAYVKEVEEKIDNFATPVATATALGLVKSSTADNQIAVDAEGFMSLNMVTTDKFKNGTKTFVIDGGTASVYIN